MADEWGYDNMWGASATPYWEPDVYAGGSANFNEGGGGGSYDDADLGGSNPWTGSAYQGGAGDFPGGGAGGSGNWFSNLLSGGGSALASLFGQGGAGGSLLAALGSLGGGLIGSNAASNAAGLQSQALNRGIDLQTAQWLQQQQNLAPYLQAGQGGLAQLMQLAGRQAPQGGDPAAAISGANYQLPGTTPGWTPQTIDAGAYGWTPGQGPQAGDYRYTPGTIPQAATYRYTPGAVPTLSGQELLANDPGVQFRMDEGRKALEASAAAKGGLLSGPTLAALQRQGQELGSQEYGQAWNRASQQAQLREGWNQTASQMGWGQAESEARLREQVNQVASQQGWSQAQAEATFREAMAQQASQQGFNQQLAGQQWNQGQQQRYESDMYSRMMEQNKYRYGQDVSQNQTDYDRAQALYRQRLAQYMLPFEQYSTLANLGGQAVGMYGQQGQSATNAISNLLGQQGTAQAGGATNQANSWMNALQNIGNAGQGYLQNQSLLSALSNLNR